MFDLFRRRDTAVRIFLGVILLIVSASMLLYLIPSYGTSAAAPNDQTVAQIGKEPITLHQVQVQINNLRHNRQIPNELMPVYVPQLIDQMVTEKTVAYEARRLGFLVTDSELADAIQQIGGGEFADVAVYKRFVEEKGMSVPEFEEALRENLLVNRLQNVALASVVVTPKEVEDEYKRRNEKVKAEYLLFSEPTLKSQVKPSPASLEKYFEQHKTMYRLPEQRSALVAVVDREKVAASMQITDAQLRAYYNASLDQYRTKERVKVRHVLLLTTGKSDAEKAGIRKNAEDLLKQLRSGADFAELAKKNSQDPGSAANGGEVGWIVRGQTVKDFEATAFSLQPNQLSGIITTEYGFHILQVEDHQQAHLQGFDEVKNQIADTLKKQGVNDRMQALADQAQQEIAKAPRDARQIAAKLGLEVHEAQKIGSSDPVPGLVAPGVSSAIAALKKDEVSQPVPVGNDKFAIAVCTEVFPSRPAEYKDVAAQVLTQYTTQETMRLAGELSAKAVAELKSGKDINTVAKELGVEVKTPPPFSRTGAIEGVGPASVLDEAFGQPAGTVVGPKVVASQSVVAKVIEQMAADMSALSKQRDEIVTQIKQRKSQQKVELFEDSVRTKLSQEGKVKIYKDVISRLVSNYQS